MLIIDDVTSPAADYAKLGGSGELMTVPLNAIRLNNEMLFARPLNKDALMMFSSSTMEGGGQSQTFSDINSPIVLLALDSLELRLSGDWEIEILAMSEVTTLLSFLDFQAQGRQNLPENDMSDESSGLLMKTGKKLALFIEDDSTHFIALVISTFLNPEDRRLERFFSFIRNTESYWISHFLLSQMMNGDEESDGQKICNASKIYGVSESYFRKLCHNAFSRGPKKQLRLWRAANSALQLIEKDKSIATIAGNNGYASSSHFSSEIKSLFGITPKEFKKLEGLLHE